MTGQSSLIVIGYSSVVVRRILHTVRYCHKKELNWNFDQCSYVTANDHIQRFNYVSKFSCVPWKVALHCFLYTISIASSENSFLWYVTDICHAVSSECGITEH